MLKILPEYKSYSSVLVQAAETTKMEEHHTYPAQKNCSNFKIQTGLEAWKLQPWEQAVDLLPPSPAFPPKSLVT